MIEHQDTIDFNHIPQSQGLGTGVKFILAIGILAIFAIGGFSAFSSGYNHMWPSDHTMRMDLGNMPK
ncbi:MAG TPA: hypothetical protein VMA98_09980 [Candidatus Acidoferrales bacterium]|nr:hypothetical protein [Candidatus Acidoferrales bacterium]